MQNHMAKWQDLDQDVVDCRKCPRLVAWREEVAHTRRRAYRDETYWGNPVPGFGDWNARVLVVGLAPGAHGANRTGRMFTGDGSGEFLYRALYAAGFANQPSSLRRDDGLVLHDLYITAVCRCVPPQNKPKPQEIENCQPYLLREMSLLSSLEGVVALGRIAFDWTLRAFHQKGLSATDFPFSHGAVYQLSEGFPWLVASYHPSRQNTQTGRLTEVMFAAIWQKVKELIGKRGVD